MSPPRLCNKCQGTIAEDEICDVTIKKGSQYGKLYFHEACLRAFVQERNVPAPEQAPTWGSSVDGIFKWWRRVNGTVLARLAFSHFDPLGLGEAAAISFDLAMITIAGVAITCNALFASTSKHRAISEPPSVSPTYEDMLEQQLPPALSFRRDSVVPMDTDVDEPIQSSHMLQHKLTLTVTARSHSVDRRGAVGRDLGVIAESRKRSYDATMETGRVVEMEDGEEDESATKRAKTSVEVDFESSQKTPVKRGRGRPRKR